MGQPHDNNSKQPELVLICSFKGVSQRLVRWTETERDEDFEHKKITLTIQDNSGHLRRWTWTEEDLPTCP